MNYPTGEKMKVGDQVFADGVSGVIVCDFDNRELLEGYSDWDMPDVEMLGGGTLSCGVMIENDHSCFQYGAKGRAIRLANDAECLSITRCEGGEGHS